jgi:ABC-type multidrug transport system fused ATPase/permease subunit
VVIGLVGLSWSGLLEHNADARLTTVLERALITAAIARGLNGVISVAQGTEIAVQPIGVGVTITAGQILDPLNDLVERFSWLSLVASASLGTQLLLTEIATEPALNMGVSALAAAFLVLLWWPGANQAAGWLLRALALALMIRFLFTVVSLTVGWVDAWVLEQRQQTAIAELTLARDDIEAMQTAPELPASSAESSIRQRFNEFMDESRQLLDLEAQINRLQERAESAIEHLLALTVLFLVQTLLVPIGAFWLAISGFRAFLRWLRA